MAGIIEGMKKEWRQFKQDEPGERFIRHYERAQKNKSTAKTVLRFAVGTLLLAGGVVLWFIPGPGWLFVFFGLAMFAAEWKGLAKFLDKVEVRLRKWARQGKTFWARASVVARSLIVTVTLVLVAGAGYGLWIWWFAS